MYYVLLWFATLFYYEVEMFGVSRIFMLCTYVGNGFF